MAFISPIVMMIQSDELIFFRGVETTSQYYICWIVYAAVCNLSICTYCVRLPLSTYDCIYVFLREYIYIYTYAYVYVYVFVSVSESVSVSVYVYVYV